MQEITPATVTPTTNPASAANPSPEPETTATTSALTSDFETFLKLLTSQLRNQDPLEPLDSTEFVAQLASFSAVEQQINTNKKLDDLLGALTRTGIDEASRLIGRDIDFSATEIEIEQASPISFKYDLPDGATEAKLSILAASGKIVREFPLSLLEQEITWDGKDAAGTSVSPGNYALKIEALKDLDALEGGKLEISGLVEEAHIGNGDIMLVLDNGLMISPEDIQAIRSADTAPATP